MIKDNNHVFYILIPKIPRDSTFAIELVAMFQLRGCLITGRYSKSRAGSPGPRPGERQNSWWMFIRHTPETAMAIDQFFFSGRGRTSVRGAHVWTALNMSCESHLVDSFVLSFCVFKICSLLQNVFPYMFVSEMSPLLPRTSHFFFPTGYAQAVLGV